MRAEQQLRASSVTVPSVGHNAPPQGPSIAAADDDLAAINAFLKDHPTITNDKENMAGDTLRQRMDLSLKSMEDERKSRVAPLNEQVKFINEPYRLTRLRIEPVFDRLRKILTGFRLQQERAAAIEAERKRKEAEEAIARAQQAQFAADEAVMDAEQGVCTDIGSAIADAQQLGRQAAMLERDAARREREITYRTKSIVGGKAQTMRNKTVLRCPDINAAHAAIQAIGLTPEVNEFVCSLARKYEKQRDEWPDWIEVTVERSL